MENERMNKLDKQIDKLADRLESMRIAEYIDLLQKPSKIIYLNFLAGISKGLGIAVGATIVFAILIDLLSRLIVLNLPVIGDFIVQILHIIEAKQGNL
ncbi:DUF5665 domain-containing protein [Anaerosinus sp.]|uniref:DUF5665 domain-containing protein n=1 Tax=Selenobaculum sp. TaxID=3074374 RepID=UPI0015AD72AD